MNNFDVFTQHYIDQSGIDLGLYIQLHFLREAYQIHVEVYFNEEFKSWEVTVFDITKEGRLETIYNGTNKFSNYQSALKYGINEGFKFLELDKIHSIYSK